MSQIRVYIVQPTIPAYRLPFFSALGRSENFDLEVHASPTSSSGPPSAAGLPSWGYASHQCVSLLGGRLFWQRGLKLPAGFGRGDVLVLNGNPRFLSSLFLALYASNSGAGIIWWGHGWSSTSVKWRAAIRYWLMGLADVVLLYTVSEANSYLAAQRVSKQCVVLGLNNTLDSSPMIRAMSRWTDERLKAFRSAAALGTSKVLLFCGRLRSNPDTELDVAIRALALLRQQGASNDYLLVVVGSGEQQGKLTALANELGVADSVRWQGAIYDEEALAPWFMSAFCFVFPGAIGLALIHAFCYGVPVVTHGDRTRHGPEIAALRPDQNGLTFSRGDASALCSQLSRLVEDPSLRDRLSLAAKKTALEEFCFDGMVRRFKEAIGVAAGKWNRKHRMEV